MKINSYLITISKIIIILVIIILSTLSSKGLYASDLKVAIIDYEKVYYSYPDTKVLQEQLNTYRTNLLQNISSLQQNINEKQNYLLQNGTNLEKEEIIDKLVELIKLKNQLEIEVEKQNTKLKQKEKEFRTTINQKLREHIDKYRNENNYDIILDKSGIISSKNNFDVTDSVIKYILNK